MSTRTAPLAVAWSSPHCRIALDTLDRHGVATPAQHWLVVDDTAVTLYDGHPEEGGVPLSGPHILGSGDGLTASEAAAYVRGYTRATVGATEHADWSASLDDDGDWLVEFRTGGPLRSWTIAAGAEPGVPVAVLL